MNCCRLITNLFNMYLQEKSLLLLFTTAGGKEVGRVSLFKETGLLGWGVALKSRGENSFWSFGNAITAPSKSFGMGCNGTTKPLRRLSFLGKMTLCTSIQALLVQMGSTLKVSISICWEKKKKKQMSNAGNHTQKKNLNSYQAIKKNLLKLLNTTHANA